MLMKGTAARMGVMKRVSLVFKAKANKALDKMEDPRETLDYSYQRQLELLTKVRRGVADVATSRKRVELQMNQLQQQANKLEDQARKALGMGREDLARAALERKASAQGQLNDLQVQYAQLQAEEEKLTVASQRLQAKVDAFRTRKETIKATYTAAEAQTRINEAFSGISEEMGDVGMAIQRAEDKTAQMQARAGAIDELMASGALDDAVGGQRDDIQNELDMMSASSDVENELSRLKGEITAGAPKQLEGGANGNSQGAQAPQAETQAPQGQAQPASIPAADRPAEPQDGEG
jgi:phage shock protein A